MTVQLRTSSMASGRAIWVDVARGIGIILVVYGHALRGLFPAVAHRPTWAAAQDAVIYRFHMPLFFMLAGLWLWRSIAHGRGAFLQNRIKTILYPYFLWSLIEGSIELVFSRYANTPIALCDLAWIPIAPIEQFWFVYALFWGQLILFALYPRRFFLPLAAVMAVGVVEVVPFGSATVAEICLAVVYLSAGSLLATALKGLAKRRPVFVFATAAVAWIAFSGGVAATTIAPSWAIAIFCALSGSIGTIAIAILLTSTYVSHHIALLGRGSMVIYVMHSIASAAVRVLLHQAAIPLPAVWMLVIITAAGLTAPMVAWWFVGRLRITQWLGLPPIPANETPRLAIC